jgi:uncharacterized protein
MDASDRFHVRNPAAFRKVLELAASQIGNLCNYSEWAAVAGIAVETAREYASLLADTHVIRLVKPFVGGKRAEITSTPKVFFLDNVVVNAREHPDTKVGKTQVRYLKPHQIAEAIAEG